MKTTSLQFNNAIRSKAREIDARVVFYIGDNRYIIKGTDVQSIKYNASCEKELGGVEKKIATIILMKNPITERIGKETILYRETWVKFNGNWYSDFQEELIVISKKITDGKNTIKIEAVDKLTIIREQPLPSIPQQMNVDLRTYFGTVVGLLSPSYTLDSKLANPMLKLAFAKSNKVHETLSEMAVSSQGLIKTDFTVKRFVKDVIVDKLGYDTGLIDYKLDDDDMDNYKDVVVSLFSPTSKVHKSLGSISTVIPSSARQYQLGTIEFDNLYIPQLIAFDHKVDVDDYTISSSGCSLTVTSTENNSLELSIEFLGLDVNSVRNSAENKDNKTKFINNIYIQSPTVYDTRIYKSKGITVKYTGNTAYEVGDTIRVDGKHDVLITEHDLTYDGALRGTIKGVVIDG